MSNVQTSKPRAVADVSEGTILATADIAAPPERVFRALASSEIVQWWGAEGLYRTTEWTGNVEVGGRFRASGVGADGTAFAVEGEYLEVDPPTKLVHTWRPGWEQGPATTVRYLLSPIEGGTRVTVKHHGFKSASSCESHAEGWSRVLGWLLGHLAAKAPEAASPRAFFLIRLLPPRPTFIVDMTADERRVMGEHVLYWRELLAEGSAVAFGPVADPAGAWGMGVVEVGGPGVVKELEAGDPAIRSGIGMRYDVLPLVTAVVRPHAP